MSCDEKENAIQELWRRLSLTEGIGRAPMRNPVSPPSSGDFPTIQFFDMPAQVTDVRQHGKTRVPVYMWSAQIVIEPFVEAESEDSATDELNAFVKSIKKVVYQGGMTLGGNCKELVETEYSQYLRPPSSSLVIGISLFFNLKYIEDTSRLF